MWGWPGWDQRFDGRDRIGPIERPSSMASVDETRGVDPGGYRSSRLVRARVRARVVALVLLSRTHHAIGCVGDTWAAQQPVGLGGPPWQGTGRGFLSPQPRRTGKSRRVDRLRRASSPLRPVPPPAGPPSNPARPRLWKTHCDASRKPTSGGWSTSRTRSTRATGSATWCSSWKG